MERERPQDSLIATRVDSNSPATSQIGTRAAHGVHLSYDYTQTLADHGVLASCGSVGDAYDNALAESFVDTFKTELITDRVWRTQAQLEQSIVEYIGWYNHQRLHEALGDRPPAEYETAAAA